MEVLAFNAIIISIESHRTKGRRIQHPIPDETMLPLSITISYSIPRPSLDSLSVCVCIQNSNWRAFYLIHGLEHGPWSHIHLYFQITLCSVWDVRSQPGVWMVRMVWESGKYVSKWAEDEWQVVDRGFGLKTIKYGWAHLTHLLLPVWTMTKNSAMSTTTDGNIMKDRRSWEREREARNFV